MKKAKCRKKSMCLCKESNQTNYLVLVNNKHKLPDDWENIVKLEETKNILNDKFLVEKQTLNMFDKLRNFLLKEGIHIELDSAYRSVNIQKKIQNEFEKQYGKEYAEKYVATPGYSEHHTGLAVDIFIIKNGTIINDNDDLIKEEKIFERIHDVLGDFGFILRYPKYKEKITGYNYEPWHFRYIGRYAAKKVYQNRLTLEEYLENIWK